MSGGKRRTPPKAEKLVDFHVDVVRETVSKYPGHPLILAGKSMGSRYIFVVSESLISSIFVHSRLCLSSIIYASF